MREFLTLLIEDDENDIFFLEHAMKRAGWPGVVKVVRDGAEGIAYLTGAGAFGDRALVSATSRDGLRTDGPSDRGHSELQQGGSW